MSLNSNFETQSNAIFQQYRRRKKFFECSLIQQKRNKKLIKINSQALQQFCNSIGLKIDKIILSPLNDPQVDDAMQITVLPFIKKSYKTFRCLMSKDLINMSERKYQLFRRNIKEIFPVDFPGLFKVTKMQHELNKIFTIYRIENGYFFNPKQKIQFVCKKFLESNEEFAEQFQLIKIKLSADSTHISKKNTLLLNLTFNLLDSSEPVGVFGTYILGNFID